MTRALLFLRRTRTVVFVSATLLGVPVAPATAKADERASTATPSAAQVPPGASGQKVAAIVVGGLGVAALGAASVAGVFSLSHRSEARRSCPESTYHFRCPTEDGAADWNAAHTTGNIATISLVTSGILLAGAAVLWFTVPKTNTYVGAGGSSVVVMGTF